MTITPVLYVLFVHPISLVVPLCCKNDLHSSGEDFHWILESGHSATRAIVRSGTDNGGGGLLLSLCSNSEAEVFRSWVFSAGNSSSTIQYLQTMCSWSLYFDTVEGNTNVTIHRETIRNL